MNARAGFTAGSGAAVRNAKRATSARTDCLTISSTQGACTLPTDTCDEARQQHCEDGLTCTDHACVSLCATGESCLAGSTCEANVCLPDRSLPDAGMDAFVVTQDDAGEPDVGEDSGELDAPPDASTCGVVSGNTRSLCVGEDFACALFGGEVHCWGNNDGGQLGDGRTPDRSVTPVRVLAGASTLTGATTLACGRQNACALAGGHLWCWGYVMGNYHAQGYELDPGLTDATELTMGNNHGCVRVASGGYQCWGESHADVAPTSGPLNVQPDGRLGFDSMVDYASPETAPDECARGGRKLLHMRGRRRVRVLPGME